MKYTLTFFSAFVLVFAAGCELNGVQDAAETVADTTTDAAGAVVETTTDAAATITDAAGNTTEVVIETAEDVADGAGEVVDAVAGNDTEDENDADDENNIVETAAANGSLSTLVAALEAGELVETLEGEGPFTVFAPTNEAFSDIQETVDTLLETENQEDLVSVLTYHVVAGEYDADDGFDGETSLETVNGQTLEIEVADDGTVTVNGAEVLITDIETSNGVVHVIDSVLVPEAE